MKIVLAMGWALLAMGAVAAESAVQPRAVTEALRHDSDDPAIWINPADPAASLVVGTHSHVPTADAQILNGGTAFPSKMVAFELKPCL